MTTLIRNRFVAAFAVSTLCVLTACGGSDGASDTASAAILESSESLTVTGEALPPLEDRENDAAAGMEAPVIVGATFDGTGISIGGASDGPTMLVFLAHWCSHCNDEIPEIIKLRNKGLLPDNLNIIGVSTAVKPDRDNYPPSKWIVEKNWTWPMLADTADSEAIQMYGGSDFPFVVMLNADGTVNARKSGYEPASQTLDWINAALLST